MVKILPSGYWPYMTGSTNYFLCAPKMYSGLTYVLREGYRVVHDYEPHKGVHTYSSHKRFGIDVTHHRGVWGNAGA